MEKKIAAIVNLTPGPSEIANIVRFAQNLHANGNHTRAFEILLAGWPHMKAAQAIRLLRREIDLATALTPEQ